MQSLTTYHLQQNIQTNSILCLSQNHLTQIPRGINRLVFRHAVITLRRTRISRVASSLAIFFSTNHINNRKCYVRLIRDDAVHGHFAVDNQRQYR